MRSAAIVIMAAATRVLAQTTQAVPTYESSLNMTVNPGTVDDNDKYAWCQAQYNTCRTLCDDNTNANDCTPANLTWECTCASNNSMPGLEFYEQTMPTLICMELFGQCQAGTNSAQVQGQCVTNIQNKCGKIPPPKKAVSNSEAQSSTTAQASTSTTASSSARATNQQATTTTDSKDIAAPTLMPGNGVAAVAAIGVLAYML